VLGGNADPIGCNDNPRYKFALSPIKERKCKWLARKALERRRTICRNVEGVSDECVETCGGCSTRSITTCRDRTDNENFRFSLKPGKERSCQWLAGKDYMRITNVCSNVAGVSSECRKTCQDLADP